MKEAAGLRIQSVEAALGCVMMFIKATLGGGMTATATAAHTCPGDLSTAAVRGGGQQHRQWRYQQTNSVCWPASAPISQPDDLFRRAVHVCLVSRSRQWVADACRF